MKSLKIIFVAITLSSFFNPLHATVQKKKILSLFEIKDAKEESKDAPQKKQTAKLIKLFDSIPNEPLPEYQSVNLQKYYQKEQEKPSKIVLKDSKEVKPIINLNKDENIVDDIDDTEEAPLETTTKITTLADVLGQAKEDETEHFPKGANYYDKITKMVKKAFSLVGSAYKFGASAGGNTYDCSLFTQSIFKKVGLTLPRSSIEQSAIGKKISKENLVVGDLLFFKTYRKSPSHVGIYIGDNKMIHASTQKGVTIDDIDDNYYKKRYLFAKRPNFVSDGKINN